MKYRGPIWVLLAGALAIGICLIVASKYVVWDFGIIHEIGVALIVAGILGLTIDFTLKTAIATDVFQATLGYILRPEFRAEVSRIAGYKFIAEKHVLLVEIRLVANRVVEVTTSIERKIRNITAYAESVKAYLHIDDWGFDEGKSEILECRLNYKNQTITADPVPTTNSRLKREAKAVILGPNEVCTLFFKLKEYRRDNDVVYFHFETPAIDPEIEVRVPAELDCSFGFGSSDTDIEHHQYANRATLTGTYFPSQAMNVRWWPKAAG